MSVLDARRPGNSKLETRNPELCRPRTKPHQIDQQEPTTQHMHERVRALHNFAARILFNPFNLFNSFNSSCHSHSSPPFQHSAFSLQPCSRREPFLHHFAPSPAFSFSSSLAHQPLTITNCTTRFRQVYAPRSYATTLLTINT